MTRAPAPRPAATVLVLRSPTGPGPLEVFLVKRHGRSGFMAGAHVFPGGRVDEADAGLADTLGADAVAYADAALDGTASPREAASFFVAAVRETAEECGLLLARDAAGARPGADVAERVFRALAEGAAFSDLLTDAGLVPDVESMVPVAWWTTPELEPKRYDTRFFAALSPPGQRAGVDAREVTEGDWFTPPAALAAYAAGEIQFAPPTLALLEDLGAPETLADIEAAAPRPHRNIQPVITQDDAGGMVLALPGDPLHPEDERATPGARTRIVMTPGGRFVSDSA